MAAFLQHDSKRRMKAVCQAAQHVLNPETGKPYRITKRQDYLIVNNVIYGGDCLESLPELLRPENIATQTKNDVILFFTRDSPFSNHHDAVFHLDGILFTSSEQYYMYQKAIYFGDLTIARQILDTHDPAHQKRISKRIKGFNRQKWQKVAPSFMENALLGKFGQNSLLASKLVSTKKYYLGEASSDLFWAIGFNIYNPRAADRLNWPGMNYMGKLLMKVRDQLDAKSEI